MDPLYHAVEEQFLFLCEYQRHKRRTDLGVIYTRKI